MMDYFPLPKPRPTQAGALERIHQALVVEDKRVFLLDAPTGVGKSAIGVAAASYYKTAFITSPQNALVDQYQKDYHALHVVKGKANYRCRNFPFTLYREKLGFLADDDRDCQTAGDLAEDRHKEVCADYVPARNAFWRGPLSATNVDFLFWAPCPESLGDGIPHRRLLVIDECHGLEKKLIELGTLKVTPGHCAEVGFDFRQFPRVPNQQGKVELALRAFQDRIVKTPFDSKKKARIYSNKSTAINVALESGDWFYWTGEKGEFVVCPMKAHVAAAKLFAKADKLLFMSATVGNPGQFLSGLGIAETDATNLAVDSPFPLENRMLSFQPAVYMTHKTYPQALPKMQKVCRQVIDHYPKDKGLVLCTGYKLQLDLAQGLQALGSRILVHTVDNRDEVIARHCNSSEPTVLLGVAMNEGIDLKDERARFLIFPKVPFPSLGDPYTKERKRRDERWYAGQTALAIVQGAGRVVRSETDHAELYMLDGCFERFINDYEALFPPWFLDAIEFGQTKTLRRHRVPRTLVKMMLGKSSRRGKPTRPGKWVVWMDRGRLRLSPPWRVP